MGRQERACISKNRGAGRDRPASESGMSDRASLRGLINVLKSEGKGFKFRGGRREYVIMSQPMIYRCMKYKVWDIQSVCVQYSP